MTYMAAAVAKQGNQPLVTFQALEEVVQNTLGVKLFTIMEVDNKREVVWRSYTNMPDAYPLLGEKPKPKNRWSDIVEGQKKTFVANSIDEIAEVFSDYELIQSLGCESCLNLPVFVDGKLRGTLNCLHESGYFTTEKVGAAETLKEAGTLAFLLAESIRNQGEINE